MSSTGAAGGGITAAHCSAQITTQGKPLASLKQVFTTPTELLAAVSPLLGELMLATLLK